MASGSVRECLLWLPDMTRRIASCLVGGFLLGSACVVYVCLRGIRKLDVLSPARTLNDMSVLKQAIENYHNVYNVWPLTTEAETRALHVPGNQGNLIAILKGGNPQGIAFIRLHSDQTRNGEFIDPWGQAYHVTLDGNRDGRCEGPRSSVWSNRHVLIWSEGSGALIVLP